MAVQAVVPSLWHRPWHSLSVGAIGLVLLTSPPSSLAFSYSSYSVSLSSFLILFSFAFCCCFSYYFSLSSF